MNLIRRLFISPSRRARDAYMGLGLLFLVLAVIAFAGADFTFDAERKALLRPLAAALAAVGALMWLRGSFGAAEDGD